MARSREEILALLNKTRPHTSGNVTIQRNVVLGAERNALQRELRSASSEKKTPISAITTAMKETQRRAAEDREKALAGVTGRETSALGAITGREAPALEAIKEGRTRGLEGFAGTEELLAQARGEVSPEREAMMYEQGRMGIEAGTQAGQRQLQERYARGGAPGGAMMRMMGDVRAGGQGQLSELQRKIQLDRYNKLMGLTGQAGQIAGQKAGIHGQTGRSLADIYGQTGRGLADVYGTTGRTLANIYSNTIAAVPEYPEIPSYTPSYGTTTTRSGGSVRRSTAPRRTTASSRFSQRARESTGAGIARHRAAMKRSGGFPKRRLTVNRVSKPKSRGVLDIKKKER
jgi:hypothetical protein